MEKKTLLFWLPLVAALLLTTSFGWAGGGKGHAPLTTASGFLKKLPGAFVDPVTRLDKMGYYDLAKRDSIALRQRLTIQGNYARQLGLDISPSPTTPAAHPPKQIAGMVDSNLARIRQKLDALKQAIKPAPRTIIPAPSATLPSHPETGRFEQAIHLLQRDEGSGAELRELNSVVEKLLALQHGQTDTPRRSVPIRNTPTATQAPTTSAHPALTVTALPDEDDTVGHFDSTRIEALISEETILVSGGQLRLQLQTDILIGRQRVPAGTPLHGIATLTGERLRISIDDIAAEGHIFPVQFEVEDEDGIAGIYIPGAPISEAFRESAGQELGSLGSGMVSTTLTGQAAGAGMVLARSLIGKKVRPVKVTIPAGYHVVLHPKNSGI